MLYARRRLEVTNGDYVTIAPQTHLAWPDAVPMFTARRQLHVVYHDQGHRISADVAAALVREGLAVNGPAGPADTALPSAQYDLIADWAVRHGGVGPGVNYGCGDGTLMRELQSRRLLIDGVDSDERLASGLAAQAAAGARLTMADITECAFPGQYGYAIAGPEVLQRLPSWSALTRHLRLAAATVRPGGRYLAHLDPGVDRRSLRHDPVDQMSLVDLGAPQPAVFLSAGLGQWQNFFCYAPGWRLADIVSAGRDAYWFDLLRR